MQGAAILPRIPPRQRALASVARTAHPNFHWWENCHGRFITITREGYWYHWDSKDKSQRNTSHDGWWHLAFVETAGSSGETSFNIPGSAIVSNIATWRWLCLSGELEKFETFESLQDDTAFNFKDEYNRDEVVALSKSQSRLYWTSQLATSQTLQAY